MTEPSSVKPGKFPDFDLISSLTSFFLPFFVYLRTLAPTIVGLDSAELTTAAATLGITRATGYPLYTLLGHLFFLLPFGDAAYRLNLFSAVCGAATVLLVERILRRLGTGLAPALAAAGLLAFAPYFWSLSLAAEVYTLNTALIAATLLACLGWIQKPDWKRTALFGLLTGLGLSHHGSFALALPGILLLAAASRPRDFFKPRCLVILAAFVVAGLSFYLYLPLRYLAGPVFDYAGYFDSRGQFIPADLASLSGLWWLVSGRAFSASMFSYSLDGFLAQLQVFLGQISRALLFVGLGPALLGLAGAFKKSRPLGWCLTLIFLGNAAFYLDYGLADKATMFLPAYLSAFLWTGLGFDLLIQWLKQSTAPEKSRAFWRRILPSVLEVVMVACSLAACLLTWSGVDRSGDYSDRLRGEEILAALKPSSVVVAYWDTLPVLQYLTQVEGRRKDLLLINRFLISEDDLRELIAGEAGTRPFYIDDRPDVLPPGIDARLSPCGLLELARQNPVE